MGGQQSSASGGERGGTTAKTCYYDLLEVDQTASSDDIRKAYRRKALELHPDKNITDVENATQRFAEVQTAYDILSDPQERAWYDSHRDAILQNQEVADLGQDPSHFRNVRITSAEDIVTLVSRFNAAVPFTDEPTGFFGSLSEIFDQLAAEEAALGDHNARPPVSYPPFGTSTSDFDSVVRPFYHGWAGFSTRKTFSWKDKYRLPDAPDRRVRRLMEKENKKCREDAIRDFNDSVRFLVGFSRKRDPRYVPNTQSDSDRQQALRDTVAAQAARSRAAHQEKLLESMVAEWVQAGREDEPVDDMFESEEEAQVEQIECVVCNKVFKSENQYNAHERSKKHVKAVQNLRREMKKENRDLDLESRAGQKIPEASGQLLGGAAISSDVLDNSVRGLETSTTAQNSDPITEPCDSAYEQEAPSLQSQGGAAQTEPAVSTNEFLPSSSPSTDTDTHIAESFSSVTLHEEETQRSKVGKAKARRAKKAAREAAPGVTTNSGMACQVCGEVFSSRSKLFVHIREKKHAALRQQVPHEATKKQKRPGRG